MLDGVILAGVDRGEGSQHGKGCDLEENGELHYVMCFDAMCFVDAVFMKAALQPYQLCVKQNDLRMCFQRGKSV